MKVTRLILFVLSLSIVFTCLFAGCAKEEGNKMELRNWQQSDEPWGSVMYDGYSFASSACGVMSLVNAVHYLTGNWMDPIMVADWANSYQNESGTRAYTGTDGTAWYVFYPNVTEKFGKKYGFKVTAYCESYGKGLPGDETSKGRVDDPAFIEHIKNGGVAVVHVYNHFMAVVDYNEEDGTFLLWDNAAGPVCGYKRVTDTDGDWWTAEEMEGLYGDKLIVNWYCLISKAGK